MFFTIQYAAIQKGLQNKTSNPANPHPSLLIIRYNLIVKQTRNLPNRDRTSVLIATILLAFTLAKFTNIPEQTINFQAVGVFIPLVINLNTVVALLVTGMTAAGTDWLLRDHPNLGERSTIPHWVLPAFSAWVIHVTLSSLTVSPTWWLAFALGGFLLLLVIIGEYVLLDSEDIRHPLAKLGLNALSYSLFLVVAVSFRSTDVRLFILLPALTLAAGMVSLRILNIGLEEDWPIAQALVSLVVVGQFAAVLHYLPLNPIGFGLIVLGLIYGINTFLINLKEEENIRKAALEPLSILIAIWIMALVIRR